MSTRTPTSSTMESSIMSCDVECVCSICQDLLTENPEVDAIPGPSQSKRVRTDSSSQSPNADTSTPELCTTPCGHVFHKSCLLNWTTRKTECPTCRKKVVPVFHKNVTKLTRIFLPLTAGQCRNCKERVKQVEIAQLDYALEKSLSDVCRKEEKEWREKCIMLVQKNEELREQQISQEEQVEELQMQLETEKVDKKLVECQMLKEKLEWQETVRQLQQQIGEKEEAEESLKERCGQLENEKKQLESALKEEKKRVVKQGRTRTPKDWEDLYKLAVLEKEKLKSDRDYERGRADMWEEWYDQLLKHNEDRSRPSHHRSIDEIKALNDEIITNAASRAVIGDVLMREGETIPAKLMKKRTPQLSDSEDDDDGYNTGYQEKPKFQPSRDNDKHGGDESSSDLALSSSDEDDESSGSSSASESSDDEDNAK